MLKRLFYIFLIFAFGFSTSAFASYDVVKAKTIVPENNYVIIKSKGTTPTFNDPELPNFSESDSIGVKIQDKIRNLFNKNKSDDSVSDDENSIIQEEQPIQEEVLQEESAQDESFQDKEPITKENIQKKSINHQEEIIDNKNKFQVNADSVTYSEDDGNVYAKGHVEIISKEQGVTLKADDAVLDRTSQTLKLTGNVKIIKDGTEMTGESMLVDLNEENVLMDDPSIDAFSFVINAQEGYLIANDLLLTNGTVKSDSDMQYPFETRGFMRLDRSASDIMEARKKLEDEKQPASNKAYKINAKEIVLTCYKDHNSLLLKDSDLFYNNHKIARKADFEIISNKENSVSDISFAEIGTLKGFGTYIGYGLVNKLPKGQILKITPALVYGESNFGVGIMGTHRSQNSVLEAGWSTSTSNLIARGQYKLGNGFDLRYGRNAYIPEGFMGARRSGYAAQLEYKKSCYNKDLRLNFNNGIYAGIFSDYRKHDQEHAYATTRFRYIAELRKNIFRYQNDEQDFDMFLSAVAQASATLYGSGETVGVARIGPTLTTRLKRWESSLGYMLGGIHGDSPFIFDKYRYGKSTIMLNERFNFSDKFAIGYRAFISPMKDNYEDDLLTESRLYAIFGPRDLKVALSYDFVREVGHIDFMFLIGGDSSKIDFEKLTTQNADGSNRKQDFYRNAKRIKIEDTDNI